MAYLFVSLALPAAVLIKTTIMAWLLSRVPYNRRLITLEEGSREFSLIVKDENGKTLNSVVPPFNPAT
jgi:hypothetical protein